MQEPKVIKHIQDVPVIKYSEVESPYGVSDGWLYHYDSDASRPSIRQIKQVYEQVICDCGNEELQILYTNSYETSAYCKRCDRLWEVHTG